MLEHSLTNSALVNRLHAVEAEAIRACETYLLRLVATDAECTHFELSLEWEDELGPDVLVSEVASLHETVEYVTLEWYFRVETIC